jgi:hypothetical protein
MGMNKERQSVVVVDEYNENVVDVYGVYKSCKCIIVVC